MSIARVRPSGETPTDIDVPSLTVTSRRVGAGAAPNAPAATVTANKALRITRRLPRSSEAQSERKLSLPRHICVPRVLRRLAEERRGRRHRRGQRQIVAAVVVVV